MEQIQEFFQGQIKEISNQFNPDLWWFDGDWEHSAEEWESEKVRNMILTKNPHAIINGRLQGYGDYATPEQNFPVSRPKDNWWELCMTTNDNWGFHHDNNWKTPYEVISIFVDAVSNGGNLLLDMGPMEDGTIPAEQINVLKELGAWNKKMEKPFLIPSVVFLKVIIMGLLLCQKIQPVYIFLYMVKTVV